MQQFCDFLLVVFLEDIYQIVEERNLVVDELLVDDLAATGGTLVAQVKLIEKLGAQLVGIACFMELEFLNPRGIMAHDFGDREIYTLVKVK